jgi:beta-lactamase regulating signal transducer with metallopeptidase domain
MLNILVNCFFVIEPLLEYFKRTLQKDTVIGCDDTGVTFLYPKVDALVR